MKFLVEHHDTGKISVCKNPIELEMALRKHLSDTTAHTEAWCMMNMGAKDCEFNRDGFTVVVVEGV